ncbi:cyclin-dependent kinase inhibitor family protein [Actinidia rufa]|uniref:Cyclin-dependent kinase inhibitor family protein n=1 Tax=Actinidia rufa TaxID=165716 RepID=A0A7J0EJN6_9ERIC|nr:cyclin-dependent kinase inhibitor family protein [Actinidia rufa]
MLVDWRPTVALPIHLRPSVGDGRSRLRVAEEQINSAVGGGGSSSSGGELSLWVAAVSSGTAKRRKIGGREAKLSSSLIQLGSYHSAIVTLVTPENSISASDDRCSSQSSHHVPASCCSSNASSDFQKETFRIVDLEDDSVQYETSTSDFGCSERRAKTPSSKLQSESGDLESTTKPSEANSRRKLPAEKMPSDTELKEFFSAAEKDIQKRFMEKYNYDIVKDAPTEGRYDWVRLKP